MSNLPFILLNGSMDNLIVDEYADRDTAFIGKKYAEIVIKGNRTLQFYITGTEEEIKILLFNSSTRDDQLVFLDKEGKRINISNFETKIKNFVEDIFTLNQEEALCKLRRLHNVLQNANGATQDEINSIRFMNSKSAKK